MADPVETSEILAFTRTVESKSLSRAAIELGVPRATLSRRLARLESRLGVRLLRRTTRSLALTDAGDAFYLNARLALEAVDRAEQSVRRTDGAIRGVLRVTAPPVADPRFHTLICEFAARYPDVQIHAHYTTRHVDLQRDGYDVALRAAMHLEPGLIARTLLRQRNVLVASPRYLAKHGTPRTRKDLAKHRCLLGFVRGELPQTHWPLANGGKIRVEGAIVTNDLGLLFDAATRGLGIAMLPMTIAGPSVERGELVPVLDGVVESESRLSVVYLEREFVPPQLRAFVDAVVAWAPGAFRDLDSSQRSSKRPARESKPPRAKPRNARAR